jgi:hypothetical protein
MRTRYHGKKKYPSPPKGLSHPKCRVCPICGNKLGLRTYQYCPRCHWTNKPAPPEVRQRRSRLKRLEASRPAYKKAPMTDEEIDERKRSIAARKERKASRFKGWLQRYKGRRNLK